MSFGTFLYTLLIKPLELVFEIIYSIANSVIVNPGLSIIALSLTMNFLVLPLYMRADALQMEEQDREKKLKFGVDHIKKTFKGDERFMMLQAYYRENDYKPIYALRGSFSLLLEIPFFIAAYHFLSHLELIKGVSFGPIADLGAPDSLIVISGVTINLLPILMTVINLISSMIYAKGSTLRTMVQLIVVALVFLVFLYKSPSGLVFYWTLNNLFSLIKNIFYKLKNPRKVLATIVSYAGILVVGMVLAKKDYSIRQRIILLAFCLFLQIPIVVTKFNIKRKETTSKGKSIGVFLGSTVFIAILAGLLITSQVIATSTAEFVSITNLYNPITHVVYSCVLAFGLFVIWIGIFYYLSDDKGKAIFCEVTAIIAVVASVDYMFFGTKLGNLSPLLQFDNMPTYAKKEYLFNLLVITVVIVVIHFVNKKNNKILVSILMAGIIAISFMSIKNIKKINGEYTSIKKAAEQADELPTYTFSKNGKNVVVLMMDRMLGDMVPYIMNEKPELQESFDGFVNYENCTSFATSTNVGLPLIYGGYEYTPTEVNKRDKELLVDKHNESLKVLPVIFDQGGFNVTVCDPTYANYSYIPDLSIYDEYPNIKKYITMGRVSAKKYKTGNIKELVNRNIFCYALFKTSPVFAQKSLYNNGNYYSTSLVEENNTSGVEATVQVRSNLYQATGIDSTFYNSYNVLDNMIGMTQVEDNSENNFIIMCNEITHNPCILQLPDYTPEYNVDNSAYIEDDAKIYDKDGDSMDLNNEVTCVHYHVNMAAFLQLGKWFDYLKEQGVWDNTRIIIVSDHGFAVNENKSIIDYINSEGEPATYDTGALQCILMVKDFDSKGYSQDEETFMTNADTPIIATEGLIDNPTNPFTGNALKDMVTKDSVIEVVQTKEWQVDVDNGYTHMPGKWFSVHDNVDIKSNWEYLGDY